MQLSKKFLGVFSLLSLVAVILLGYYYFKKPTFLSKNSRSLVVKDLEGLDQPVKPGITLDNTEAKQGKFWLTGTIDKLEVYDEVLPADQTLTKEAISYSVFQITLSIPKTELIPAYRVKAITVEAIPVAVTNDGQNFESVPTTEVEKTLQVGQEVRLSVVNQESEVFKSRWTQVNGNWNTHGEMMLYLLNKNRENTYRLLNDPQSVKDNTNILFDGILYN